MMSCSLYLSVNAVFVRMLLFDFICPMVRIRVCKIKICQHRWKLQKTLSGMQESTLHQFTTAESQQCQTHLLDNTHIPRPGIYPSHRPPACRNSPVSYRVPHTSWMLSWTSWMVSHNGWYHAHGQIYSAGEPGVPHFQNHLQKYTCIFQVNILSTESVTCIHLVCSVYTCSCPAPNKLFYETSFLMKLENMFLNHFLVQTGLIHVANRKVFF